MPVYNVQMFQVSCGEIRDDTLDIRDTIILGKTVMFSINYLYKDTDMTCYTRIVL